MTGSETPLTDAVVIDLQEALLVATNPNGTRRYVTKYVDADFARALESDHRAMREALAGLLACIMETRGPNANDAVDKARSVLAGLKVR